MPCRHASSVPSILLLPRPVTPKGTGCDEAQDNLRRRAGLLRAPVAAQRVDDNTWTFNTTDYHDPVSQKPIEYQAGWRIGTQYILTEQLSNGTLETYKFPKGIEKPEDLEYHYFAFDMPPVQDRSTPAPGIGVAVACLALAAWRRQ